MILKIISKLSKMAKSGYRDFKWNISRSEGQILAYDSIKQILIESKNNLLELNELIVLINQRTKHLVIKNYTKRRNLINYLKINYGGIIQFLDDYDIFGIIKKENKMYVKLIDDFLDEWVLIDDLDI